MKRELRKETLAEVQSRERSRTERLAQARPPGSPPALKKGQVVGRMLYDGAPLKGCRVKIVGMIPYPTASAFFKAYREGPEFETVTTEQGRFHFAEVPAGQYRIKWRPPGETGWIRRLRQDPDFRVEDGKTASLQPIETHRPLVPR